MKAKTALPVRILIPVANPTTAEELVRIGAAILDPRHGELSALGRFVRRVGALGYALSRPRPEDPIPTALVIKSKNLKS